MGESAPPNRNALWADVIVDELAKSGLERAVIAPGSRSTPLVVALAESERLRTVTHLDERSAAFFALGQGKLTGRPTVVVTTSGTAAANLHPAVIEAHHSRTPLLVLTADRPAELQDSGANQTVDQTALYGSAVRYDRTLPEPEPTDRTLRSLRTLLDRAVAASMGNPPGPVHLNVPFRKPLAPVEVPGDVPAALSDTAREAVEGREGPFVQISRGMPRPAEGTIAELAAAIQTAPRGLIVVGPMNPDGDTASAIGRLAGATGYPLLADPLSGLRFGEHADGTLVLGGYDGYLQAPTVGTWPDPDLVFYFGASPTSKPLRHYLRDAARRQVLVDPAGGWREATFTATDRIDVSPSAVSEALLASFDGDSLDRNDERAAWRALFAEAESIHWTVVDETIASDVDPPAFEGEVLHRVAAASPPSTTLFVSNSMPVRDLDRFGEPRDASLVAVGNRGASGIDGIASTGLGAGSVADEPIVIVTGDLAYLHDANGLLAIERFDLDATIVLVNNDGGGIFHMLPIEDFDPPFESYFRTPHHLDLGATGPLYGLEFARVETVGAFEKAFARSVSSAGAQVIEVRTDAGESHQTRDAIAATVADRLESME